MSDKKFFGLVVQNGEPVAVPVDKLPKNHFDSKTRTRAKFTEEQVKSLGVDVVDSMPEKVKKVKVRNVKEKAMSKPNVTVSVKQKKMPKLVSEWQEIREAIRDGRKLKLIAQQYNVRYYDVYRVKVHAMDL